MTEQDDNLSLPPPPPPAPARREGAIEEALRRFDAEGEASQPIRAEPRHSGFRRGIGDRPQLGILAAAALVAVIGLTLAWLTVTQKSEPAAELASRAAEDLKTFNVEERRPPAVVFFEPETTVQRPVTASRKEPPSSITGPDRFEAPEPEAAARLAEATAGRGRDATGNRRDGAPAQLAVAAAPIIAAPAPVAAPPPAMAKAEAPAAAENREQFADTRDVVVTAMKRRSRAVPERGDWNACTIDDPKRSLAACKSLVNPAAKGVKGQADSYLADGLSLAWQGNVDRAITAFDRAIMINPKSSLAYLNRGLAWRRKGEGERALADLDRAVKLAPNMARSYYSRSLVQRDRGNNRRAKADQSRAMDLDPEYEAVID